jgi:hypothetical protein
VGQQLRFRETYYRIDASFRVRGVARVHRHVGAARLAGTVGSTAFSLPGSVAAFWLEELPPHGCLGNYKRVANQCFDRCRSQPR